MDQALFALYALLCLLAVSLNRNRRKRQVCWTCAGALLLGLALDPLAQMSPAVVAYAIAVLINAGALYVMPYTRGYLAIPVLFTAGVLLCVSDAVWCHYRFTPEIPYNALNHGLNIAHILVLLGGSDDIVRVSDRHLFAGRACRLRRVYRRHLLRGFVGCRKTS